MHQPALSREGLAPVLELCKLSILPVGLSSYGKGSRSYKRIWHYGVTAICSHKQRLSVWSIFCSSEVGRRDGNCKAQAGRPFTCCCHSSFLATASRSLAASRPQRPSSTKRRALHRKTCHKKDFWWFCQCESCVSCTGALHLTGVRN